MLLHTVYVIAFANTIFAEAKNITGSMLSEDPKHWYQTLGSISTTVIIGFIMVIGAVNAVIATYAEEKRQRPDVYVKAVGRRYQAVARATLMLPASMYITAYLFSAAVHQPTLWTATNIALSILLISTKIIYDSLNGIVNEAVELSMIRAIYEVVCMGITSRIVVNNDTRKYKPFRESDKRQEASLWFPDTDKDPKNQNRQITERRIPLSLHSLKAKILEIASDDVILKYNVKTWVINDLSATRNITGLIMLEQILKKTRLVSWHLQEAYLAAKDEFLITVCRF